jgi:predicted Zn-dependent peptidase
MDHTSACFELLSDLFLNSTYPEDEMQREKGVVCEEISMSSDTPEDVCMDQLSMAYYGKENYGRNILGTVENVNGFTVEDIAKYKNARYCPENIVISFAGAIDMTTAQALVETYFGNLAKGNFEKRKPTLILNRQSLVTQKTIEQMHIAIAYPALARGDARCDQLTAIDNILGGSMSARLFQEVREKRGLAYSVYSYVSAYNDCGTQNIYAGVNPQKAEEAFEAILNVVNDIKHNGFKEEEFLRSREQMKSSLFFRNESTNSQMILYGRYLLDYDELFDFDEKLKNINEMTYAQASELLEVLFDDKNKALSLVGNTDKPLSF